MSQQLDCLSRQEQAACRIAERVLGATAEAWDVCGRQGAVDAMIALPDGRRAAFEVTAVAAGGALQTDSLLGADDFSWPPAGRWWWTIQVGSPADIPRLRQSYVRIGQLCEAAGVERPENLWRRDLNDPDLNWLVEQSSSTLVIHFGVPAREGDLVRHTMVTSTGRSGGVDRTLSGLHDALTELFASPNIAKHTAKLARAQADERHLFLPIHRSALPFPVADALWTGNVLPPEPAPLPQGVSHLWLAPELGRRVLLGTRSGWEEHNPYDN